jgi:hypothetical protein
LWIGALPDSFLGEDAFDAASGLLEILKRHGIHNVNIEFSVYRRSTGPELHTNLEPGRNQERHHAP